MIVATLKEHYDLAKELDAMGEGLKRDADLLQFQLPIEEALAIWARGREGLLHLAELFPAKQEKIEAAIAEQEEVLLAMLERYGASEGARAYRRF